MTKRKAKAPTLPLAPEHYETWLAAYEAWKRADASRDADQAQDAPTKKSA